MALFRASYPPQKLHAIFSNLFSYTHSYSHVHPNDTFDNALSSLELISLYIADVYKVSNRCSNYFNITCLSDVNWSTAKTKASNCQFRVLTSVQMHTARDA